MTQIWSQVSHMVFCEFPGVILEHDWCDFPPPPPKKNLLQKENNSSQRSLWVISCSEKIDAYTETKYNQGRPLLASMSSSPYPAPRVVLVERVRGWNKNVYGLQIGEGEDIVEGTCLVHGLISGTLVSQEPPNLDHWYYAPQINKNRVSGLS